MRTRWQGPMAEVDFDDACLVLLRTYNWILMIPSRVQVVGGQGTGS